MLWNCCARGILWLGFLPHAYMVIGVKERAILDSVTNEMPRQRKEFAVCEFRSCPLSLYFFFPLLCKHQFIMASLIFAVHFLLKLPLLHAIHWYDGHIQYAAIIPNQAWTASSKKGWSGTRVIYRPPIWLWSVAWQARPHLVPLLKTSTWLDLSHLDWWHP